VGQDSYDVDLRADARCRRDGVERSPRTWKFESPEVLDSVFLLKLLGDQTPSDMIPCGWVLGQLVPPPEELSFLLFCETFPVLDSVLREPYFIRRDIPPPRLRDAARVSPRA